MSNRLRKRRAGNKRAKGWKRGIAIHDDIERRLTLAAERHEVAFTACGIDPGTVVTAKPPRRPRRRAFASPDQVAFWFSVPGWLWSRRRGVCANTAPARLP